jgi:hypothetical protein
MTPLSMARYHVALQLERPAEGDGRAEVHLAVHTALLRSQGFASLRLLSEPTDREPGPASVVVGAAGVELLVQDCRVFRRPVAIGLVVATVLSTIIARFDCCARAASAGPCSGASCGRRRWRCTVSRRRPLWRRWPRPTACSRRTAGAGCEAVRLMMVYFRTLLQ